MDVIGIDRKFSLFSELWRPKIVARLNEQDVKLVRIKGVFPWHVHDHCEEMFLVWKGAMQLEYRHLTKTVSAGEMVVVPRGVEHRTLAEQEAQVLLFEPAGTRNTGDIIDPMFTAPMDDEI